MSSIRNIIARRRPSIQVEPEDSAASQSPAKDADRAEPTLHGSGDQGPARRVDHPPAVPDIPRWELPPPKRTMGDQRVAETPQAPEIETPKDDAPPISARRKIWDLDAENAPAEVADQPQEQPPKQDATPTVTAPPDTSPDMRAPLPAGPDAAPVRRGRVKTRLLGFHADDAIADAFSKDRAAATSQSVKYPVGWVVVVEGPGEGHCFSLAPGLSTIGRGADQTIAIDFGDDCISRDTHASIAYDDEENKILIGHGGKANLVRLNGKPLVSVTEMQSGDQFRIGKTTLRFVALCGGDFRWPEMADND